MIRRSKQRVATVSTGRAAISLPPLFKERKSRSLKIGRIRGKEVFGKSIVIGSSITWEPSRVNNAIDNRLANNTQAGGSRRFLHLRGNEGCSCGDAVLFGMNNNFL